MSARLTALPAPHESAPAWEQVLAGALRPEFRVELYVPAPDDRMLFGPPCAVGGCPCRGAYRRGDFRDRHLYLCVSHTRQWRKDGEPEPSAWAATAARPLWTLALADRCRAHGCPRSAYNHGFCYPHFGRWKLRGRPDPEAFAATAGPVWVAKEKRCRVPRCGFPAMGNHRLCDTHNRGFHRQRAKHAEITVTDFVAHVARARLRSAPRYDLRGLPPLLTLELQFVLQRRHDERRATLDPRDFRQLVHLLRELEPRSLLGQSGTWWERVISARCRPRGTQCPERALVRYARDRLQRLRAECSGPAVWEWDTWIVAHLPLDPRYAHQRQPRIYFAGIEPAWLRELAKRWARWRLQSATLSPGAIRGRTDSLRHFTRFAEREGLLPRAPAELTRALLERYLMHVQRSPLSVGQRRRLLSDVRVFLDEVARHGWAEGLPANARYFDGELPHREAQRLPRFIDEFVMAQIESEANLARLPDETSRTAILVLIESGLRSIDALRLPFDPITHDQAGAPYLAYYNHKLGREAIIPVSDRLARQIRRQQEHLRERFPDADSPYLLPRLRASEGGRLPYSADTLADRLRDWLAACDIRDAAGRPAHVTPHQFRHTLATRLINNDVPLDTVRRLLDHNSPAMTARYAQLHDQTLRREWERYQERVNIRGEVVPLDPAGPVSDAAWAKERIARAKQTLANGYCGLPLQQSCPHPNACLTCANFLTTTEFLPVHREQLERTRTLIADAEEAANERLVEMNRPVELNLVRIIDGLEALDVHEVEDADAA